MTAWDDSLRDSNDSKHSSEAFMAKSDDWESKEEVTLFDLQQNLNVYCVKKLWSLATVLTDSIIELTIEKNFMNNILYSSWWKCRFGWPNVLCGKKFDSSRRWKYRTYGKIKDVEWEM